MRVPQILLALLVSAPAMLACQTSAPPVPPEERLPAVAAVHPRDDQLYTEAAARAWAWVDRNYRPATGLVRATDHYALVTTWDIGSGMLAHFAARELGLLPEAEYDRRMRRMLLTLQTMPLYDSTAFSRFYSAETGRMHGRDEQPTRRGYGWSATDLGRLLTALKVVASNHRQYEGEIDQVVRRLDYRRVIRDGYLWGEDVRPTGRVARYPEGRIGYEQYAAQGFALWGHRAERALDPRANAKQVTVEGVELLGDRRGADRITSEPFFLAALESGLWGEDLNREARAVLSAQEARYRRTQQITMVSEDALPVPPYHFYYYTVYHDGRPWAIDAQAPMTGVRVGRWMSTKAAFAWHAVAPGDYTRRALEAVVAGHARERDWTSGIYEESGRPTGGANVNTAAVILEAALYRRLGRRLYLEPGG